MVEQAESPRSRVDLFEDFLMNDPDFICPWGRQSAKKNRITTQLYPETDDLQAGTDHIVHALQDGFADRKKDVCALVHPGDKNVHQLEYFRSMQMYVRTYVAAGLCSGHRNRASLEKEAWEIAHYFFLDHPEKFTVDFPQRGKIPFQNDELMVLQTSPLYPDKHPRKSPVAAWVITRLSDASNARKACPHAAQRTLADAWGRTDMPYAPILPYIIPDNLHFAVPSFTMYLNLVREYQRIFGIEGDVGQKAAAMCRFGALCMKIDEQGNLVVDTEKITREAIMKILEEPAR